MPSFRISWVRPIVAIGFSSGSGGPIARASLLRSSRANSAMLLLPKELLEVLERIHWVEFPLVSEFRQYDFREETDDTGHRPLFIHCRDLQDDLEVACMRVERVENLLDLVA